MNGSKGILILATGTLTFEAIVGYFTDNFFIFCGVLTLFAMILDILTGMLKAGYKGELCSKVAKNGFWKKASTICFILLGGLLDICTSAFGLGQFLYDKIGGLCTTPTENNSPIAFVFLTLFCLWTIIGETLSIIENCSTINSRVSPKWVKRLFKSVRDELDNLDSKEK